MSVSSNHDEMGKGDPAGVYNALISTCYDDGKSLKKAPTMQQPASLISVSQPPVSVSEAGADRIRWGWWAAGVGFSVALWTGITIAFGAL